jgi:hypothetical protein
MAGRRRAARNIRLHGVELNRRVAARRAQYPAAWRRIEWRCGGSALEIFGCTAAN